MSPKILLVMRHAKSSWKTNEPDLKRPLNSRGTRDAVVAGQTLADLSPDVVWCSTAVRAEQTWRSAGFGGVDAADVRFSDDIYEADAAALLDVLRGTPASARTTLLIGHEPAVSDLVLTLAISSEATARVEEKFPTSAIAVLVHDQDWDELAPGTAQLVAFHVPRG